MISSLYGVHVAAFESVTAKDLPATRIAKSPNQLHRELNLPRWRRCLSKCTRAANRASGLVKQRFVCERCREISPIQDIEKLRPELHVKTLRDLLVVFFFEYE